MSVFANMFDSAGRHLQHVLGEPTTYADVDGNEESIVGEWSTPPMDAAVRGSHGQDGDGERWEMRVVVPGPASHYVRYGTLTRAGLVWTIERIGPDLPGDRVELTVVRGQIGERVPGGDYRLRR